MKKDDAEKIVNDLGNNKITIQDVINVIKESPKAMELVNDELEKQNKALEDSLINDKLK